MRKYIWLGIFVFLSFCVAKPALHFLIQAAVRFQYECHLSFRSLEWKDGGLLATDVVCFDLSGDKTAFYCHAPQVKFSFLKRHLDIYQPVISLFEYRKRAGSFDGTLTISEGVIDWQGLERAEFSLDWQGHEGVAHLHCRGGTALLEVDPLSIQATLTDWPLPVYSFSSVEISGGNVTGTAEISWDGRLSSGHLEGKELSFQIASAEVPSASGTVEWEEGRVKVSLSHLDATLEGGDLRGLKGDFSYLPRVGAKWQLQGEGHTPSHCFPVVCSGRTYLQSELANWADIEVALGGTAKVTLRGHEEGPLQVWTVRCQDVNAHHASLFWPSLWRSGTVNGEASVLVSEAGERSWKASYLEMKQGVWDTWPIDQLTWKEGEIQAVVQGVPLSLSLQGGWAQWAGTGLVQEIPFTLSGGCEEGGLWMRGVVPLPRQDIAIRCPSLRWHKGQIDFDLRLEGAVCDWARLKGSYAQGHCTLAEESHLFGEPLRLSDALEGTISWTTLRTLWKEKAALPIEGAVAFQLKRDSFTMTNQDLTWEGEPLLLKQLLSCSLGVPSQTDVAISHFEALDGAVMGAGHLSWGDRLEVDLDLAPARFLSVESRTLSHLFYSSKAGAVFSGLDLAIYPEQGDPLYCKTDFFHLDLGTAHWHLREARLHVPTSFFPVVVDCTADIRWDGHQFLSSLRNGFVPLAGEVYSINDARFSWNSTVCAGFVRLLHQEHLFKLSFEASAQEGRCSVEENPTNKPLTFEWDYDLAHGVTFRSIEGVFGGVDASFRPAEPYGALLGSARVDFEAVTQWIPQAIGEVFTDLEMGKGYELKGTLSNRGEFQGILVGKEVELFGFCLKTLFAETEISPTKVCLTKLKASDPGGMLSIDQILMKEPSPDAPWILDIPHITVTELRPSLLNKTPLTPLVVRELHLDDVKGLLADSKTYTGKGELFFINSFRRKFSVLELPADLLSRIIGIDLELLIPVKGSLTYELSDGVFCLQELKNAFSEGHRSEFFLVPEAHSSMDLDGNLNILIRMKQFVLFKLTEAFVIAVDGNLGDPQYHLQKRRRFLGL